MKLLGKYHAILAGVLLGMAFPTWSVYPLAWVALILVFVPAFRASVQSCGARFFVAGLVFHLFVLQWLLANIFWAGGWAVWGYAVLSVYMALYWGLFGMLWAGMRDRLPVVPLAIASAVLWIAMETLQSILLTGFGWSALGYTQGRYESVLQLASLGGVSLLSGILVAFNVLVAQTIAQPTRKIPHALAAFALLVVSHIGGSLLLDEADYGPEPYTVGMFQSDFPQQMKWDHDYTVDMVHRAAEKTRQVAAYEEVDLFVWPEALIMAPIETYGIHETLSQLTRSVETPLYTGSSRFSAERGGWTNSSYLFDQRGEIAGIYDKIHLVPFGEYAPLGSIFPFITQVVPTIGDLVPGDALTIFEAGGRRFGPLICFEVLHAPMSEWLIRENAEMLVVITNLGWFGNTNAIDQELEISRLRAVETRTPLVHCANTGHTGVFDPYGRFTAVGEPFRRFAATAPVAQAEPRLIPWGPRWFRWIAVAGAVIILVLIVLSPGNRLRFEPSAQP